MIEAAARSGLERSDMRVCAECGARALRGQAACDGCGVVGGRVKEAPQLPGELFWVQVRAEFKCQTCQQLSPINHIEARGTFECLLCHAQQSTHSEVWREGVLFGHAVADIGGPSTESRLPIVDVSVGENFDLSGLGSERSSSTMCIAQRHERRVPGKPTEIEIRSLKVLACPGHPLCERCRALLQVKPGRDGGLTTTCSGCRAVERYVLDADALELHYGLVGAAAKAYRVGYVADSAAAPHMERWWMLFRGVAPEREALANAAKERAAEEAEDTALRERAHLARLAREALAAAAARERRTRNLQLGAVALAVLLAALLFWVLLQ